MTPQQLLDKRQVDQTFTPELAGQCCLCGGADGTLDAKASIKVGFTDDDHLKAPGSPSVCPACAYVFTEKRLRTSSWVVSAAGMRWLNGRRFGTSCFTEQPDTPLAMYVTTSWKKHGSFKTRVNHDQDRFRAV